MSNETPETIIAAEIAAGAETIVVTETAIAPQPNRPFMLAADLPPAADELAALFSEEPASVETIPTEEENLAETAPLAHTNDSLSGVETETAAPEEAKSEIHQEAENWPTSLADSTSLDDEVSAPEPGWNEIRSEDAGESAWLDSTAGDETTEAAPQVNLETSPEANAETRPEITPDEDFGGVSVAAASAASAVVTPVSDWAFEEKLASHREWLESQGTNGKKANWENVSLEDQELIGISLRFADLHAANMKGADLLLADLRDTCLIRANLEETCLVGANLEGANLEGASLSTAMGLVARQLAGTNLRDASLPSEVQEFPAVADFERACRSAFQFFVALMSVSVLSALVIWRTRDAQLISNSGLISIPHFPAAAAALPTEEIYLIAPVLIFILYMAFHFHLQRLWTAMLELPAVFPDGRVLGQKAPRIIAGLLRAHFRWMNQDGAGTQQIEKIVSLLLAYGIAPAVLLLYWARYLTLQDSHGSVLQVLLATGAAGLTLYAMTRVGRPQEKWALEEKRARRYTGKLKKINLVTPISGFCVFLLLLSFGTIKGIPHEKSLAPQFMSMDIRRWGPSFFWLFGFDPYAKLPEAVISTAPENWAGADDQVSSVKGAQLNGRSLRYMEAYGAFLANAHLFRSNFQGAFLSEADLRGADLSQSSLRLADLDRARMNHANLNRAALDGANLARADLRNADLSYCSLDDATLVDAQLGGASFYQARLPFATLVRANLEKADLRSADMEGADLEHADLQQAYLWSARLPGAHLRDAQLAGAILIGANLRGADLGGALLSGTVLNEVDLTNANLAGADFRGSLGLTANQVCSAKYRQGALLDDAMQALVNAQCGVAH